MLPVIVVFALAFRLLMLFSEPIQEVDAYRYLWDGQAVSAGVNPFRYSPQQVLDADTSSSLPDDLRRLVQLRDESPAQAEILRRVHFGELTTVYPPVSQAVFALAAVVTPRSTGVPTHLLVMKFFVVAFDLATLGVLILLLRFTGRPTEWSLIYALCPLAMKEFANSGHLDSIAVFVTTAAIYCAVRGLFRRASRAWPTLPASDPRLAATTEHRFRWLLASSLLLGLGVGAKIYPAIFAPLLFVSIWHCASFRTAVVGAIVFASVSVGMVLPMLVRDQRQVAALNELDSRSQLEQESHESPGDPQAPSPIRPIDAGTAAGRNAGDPQPELPLEPQLPDGAFSAADAFRTASPETLAAQHPPVPDAIPSGPEIDPTSTGLSAFAAQWQMNDFLFLLLFENLTPDRGPDSTRNAWFVITSSDWREQLVEAVARRTGIAGQRVPFLITRVVTTAILGALAFWWAWRAARSMEATDWLIYAFLTVAWFWLLQPTQNPWYWAWALPLVPFARSRAWLLLSGLTLIYYLRFWCVYHASDTPLFGTCYAGIDFFDFVGSWIEFAPWFILLTVEFARSGKLPACRTAQIPAVPASEEQIT